MVGSNSWIYLFVSVCVTLPSRCASYSNLPDTAQVQLSLTTLSDAEKCRLPNDVTASVTLASDVIDLHLHKNEHVSSQAQVFVIKETGHGRTVVQPYSSPLDEGYKLYQDKNRTASIMLRCPTKGGTSYIVEGTFVYGGNTLRLTHSSRKRRDVSSAKAHAEEYNVVVEKEPGAATADFKEPPTEVLPKKATFQDFQGLPFALAPPMRRRRQTSPYYVDVVAVIDYAVYLDWYRRSTQTVEAYRQSETLSNIRRYFALIMNGVDLRYQGIHALPYRINIRLIGYIVAQTASVATWTERFRVVSSPRYAVNADSALTAFSDWAASSDSLPSHDHAVLFTGYDLFTIAGGTMKTATTGLAYIGTLCSLTGKSVSVVEETGAFGSVETTAHEIGHSLSAKHDGDGNTCSSNDRYIMAAGGPDLDTANKVNSWIFSSCSVDYFKNFINNMMRTSRGVTCLTTPLPVLSVPDVSAILPGQLYDPDAQCRQLHGSQSRLCRGPEFGTAASVCTSMYCYDPSTSKTCYEHVAARGTSCGDKKWCIDGQCVYSTDAPSKDDSCVFGDQEGVAFDNKDCGSFVADYPGYCYQSVVRGRCCATCKRHYIPLSNCEYGDKVAGCKTNGCGYRYQDGSIYDENCCGTCNYGTVVSTTPKPAISLTTTPTTTVTTQSGITQSPGVCKDLQGVLFDGRTCSQYLQNNLAACYNDNVRVVCCGTCEARSTKLNGCEFGDRGAPCQSAGCHLTLSDGSKYKEICCETCNYSLPTTATPTTTTTPSTTTTATTPSTTTTATTPSTTTTATTTTVSTTTRSTTPSTTTTATTPSTTTTTTTPSTTTTATTPSTTTTATTPSTSTTVTTPSTTTTVTTPSTTTTATTPSTTTTATTPSTTTTVTTPSTTTTATTPSTSTTVTTPSTTTTATTPSTTTTATTPSTTTTATTPSTTTTATTPSTTTTATTPSTTTTVTTPSTTTTATTPSTTTTATTPSTTTTVTTPSTTTTVTTPSTTTTATTPSTTTTVTTPSTTTTATTPSTITTATMPSTTTTVTTPSTTTTATTRPTTPSTTATTSATPRPSTTTNTTATTQATTTGQSGCYDDDSSLTFKCSEVVGSVMTFQCYDSYVARACCFSCRSQRDARFPGCEYGDRQPSECKRLLATKTTCPTTLQTACCATCRTLENEVNAQAAVTSLRAMWIVVFLGLLSGFLS